jgi:photosystem II stability/assembly factor-like uncharacterized protein
MVIFASRPVLLGQAASWARVGGPSGGIGYDIKVRPDNPDIMYVTDANAGVHRSTDGGLTWTSINQGIDARQGPSGDQIPAFCVTIDPNNPDVVWVGLQDLSGIYRSVNGGNTWEKRVSGIAETNGLTVRGITVQPGNSSIVYAAGEINSFAWAGGQRQGRFFDLVKGVVYKSTDAGQTWRAVWRGDNLARYVLIDPTNTSTLYVSTGIFDREAANSTPGLNIPGGVGVLKSTDAGATWTTINNGLGNLYVGSLAMNVANPSRLIAGAGSNSYPDHGGVYVTSDGGATWQYAVGQAITAVEFSSTDPGAAYASGSSEFFRSGDGGQTWQSVLNRAGRAWGPEGLLTGFPIDMQVDPRDPQRMFVNNYGGGNFLTTDGGASWALASTGYTGAQVYDVAVSRQNPAVVYANSKTGPFKSIDYGQTWSGINTSDRPINEGARVAVDPEDDNHVLVSQAHLGVTEESLDGGATWRVVTDYAQELQAVAAGTSPERFQQGMSAIAFAPSWKLKVYGGFGLQKCILNVASCDTPTIVGVLTSEDGGRTWVRRTGTGFDTSNVAGIAVHPTDRNVAWAATMGKGVFKTVNGGDSWTQVATGLTDLNIASIAVDPTRPDVLYAGSASKSVFKSRDGGVTWAASSGGMKPNEQINAILVNPVQPDTIYAGSYGSGMYASTNGGASWTLVNAGLRTRAIRALTISPDASVVYAGTFGEGVFRLGP